MTQILSKSSGGVLQIPVSVTQKNAPAAKKTPKPAAPRLKLLVRRLPPGLTQEEFETAIGEEWKLGSGKVSWSQYKPGKVSKDPAKPSRPSRAYLYVVSSEHIGPLSDKVRATSFLDARNTANDPVLLGPPNLEFAPYAKIPGSRVRKDARQGTIDQEPEFFQFLESLTQPIAKSGPVESAAEGEDKKETITTTPLVQYIKEKKANKAKESSSRSSRHKSDKDSKSEKVQSKKLLQRPDKEATVGGSEKAEKKSRSDKATKEAVKAANKQAANLASKQGSKASTAQNSPKETTPAPDRKRERGNAAAAAKILQRDLGLAPSSNRRRGRRGAAGDDETKTDGSTNAEASKKDTPAKSPKGSSAQDSKAKGGNTPQPSEASSTQRSETSTSAQTTPTSGRAPKSGKGKQASTATTPAPTPTATQAFLKHANPSQGVTEPLLETAFSPFGKVVKVEIDKKKGFGYVEFAEPDGLQKAIAASPVTVAQSQVVVLERKANPGAEKGRGKGRGEAKQPAPSTDANANRGGKPNEGGSGGNSSSRGRRSGRGNKGGSKGNGGSGGGGGGNANASESKSAETK